MSREQVDFFNALVRYETELWNVIDARLQADLGVTLARVEALGVLADRDGSCRVQDIADDLCITVGAASKLVDRLEHQGLARRTANPRDRRSSLITLTDDGRRTHRAGAQGLERHLRAHLSASYDRADITQMTTRMVAARSQLRSSGQKVGA